jgi:hypothetical protein
MLPLAPPAKPTEVVALQISARISAGNSLCKSARISSKDTRSAQDVSAKGAGEVVGKGAEVYAQGTDGVGRKEAVENIGCTDITLLLGVAPTATTYSHASVDPFNVQLWTPVSIRQP